MNVVLKDGQRKGIDSTIIEKYALHNREVTPFSKLAIEKYVASVERICVTEVTKEELDLLSKEEEERDEQQSEWDL